MTFQPYEPKPGLFVVPNELRDMINDRLDAAIAACPGASVDRDTLYHHLVGVFNEFGFIPDFKLEKRTDVKATERC